MDQWGLALESSGKLPTSSTLNNTLFYSSNYHNINKTPNNNNSNNNRNRNEKNYSMEYNKNVDDQDNNMQHQNDDHKVVIGEVDFFSNHKNKLANNHLNHVKQENYNSSPTRPHIDVNTGLHLLTTNTGSDQSTLDDGATSDAEEKRAKNELVVLQSELQRMNVENQKLKTMLSQVSQNYTSLQMHLVALMQQQKQQQHGEAIQHQEAIMQGKSKEKRPMVPRQFLDLGSGAKNETNELTSQTLSDEDRTLDRSIGSPHNTVEIGSRNITNNSSNKEIALHDYGKRIREENNVEDVENNNNQSWEPNKVPKLNLPMMASSNSPMEHATAEATMRKARVSVRARSESPMISDGCQWRKYGQKMAKGNPCPRAYYRCTMAVGCPVRKQVQRCAEDKSILITTYEGNHNHPLPPAAMAMASTTSAAASMLLSGSMPSADGLMNPNFLARTMLPCSTSMATISASAPFPTVTLDLTQQQQSQNPLQTQRPITPQFLASIPQLFGQTLLTNNNYNINRSIYAGLHTSASQPLDLASHLQMPNNQNPAFADSLSAATAAITSDPNFTAALVAAISSIISGSGRVPDDNDVAPRNNSPNGGANNISNNNSSNTMQQ